MSSRRRACALAGTLVLSAVLGGCAGAGTDAGPAHPGVPNFTTPEEQAYEETATELCDAYTRVVRPAGEPSPEAGQPRYPESEEIAAARDLRDRRLAELEPPESLAPRHEALTAALERLKASDSSAAEPSVAAFEYFRARGAVDRAFLDLGLLECSEWGGPDDPVSADFEAEEIDLGTLVVWVHPGALAAERRALEEQLGELEEAGLLRITERTNLVALLLAESIPDDATAGAPEGPASEYVDVYGLEVAGVAGALRAFEALEDAPGLGHVSRRAPDASFGRHLVLSFGAQWPASRADVAALRRDLEALQARGTIRIEKARFDRFGGSVIVSFETVEDGLAAIAVLERQPAITDGGALTLT